MDVIGDENWWSHMSAKKYAVITWAQCKSAMRLMPPAYKWRMMRTSPGGYESMWASANGQSHKLQIIIRPIDVYHPSCMWPLNKRIKYAIQDSSVVYSGSFQIQVAGYCTGKPMSKHKLKLIYRKLHRHFRASSFPRNSIPENGQPIRNLHYIR